MPPAAPRPAPWVCFALLLAVVLPWLPSLRGGFVYDSRSQILYGAWIHDGGNWSEVLSLAVLSQDEVDANRPVQLASLMADVFLWGRQPAGYRLTNVLLHTLNAFLLLMILRTAGCPWWPAAVVCWLWSVHPLAVEVVSEPSFREDALLLLWLQAGLLAVLRSAGSSKKGLGWRAAAGPALLLVLGPVAAATKEAGVAVPVVLLAAALLLRAPRPVLAGAAGGVVGAVVFLLVAELLRPAGSEVFAFAPQPIAPDPVGWLTAQTQILALYVLNILHPSNRLCADYGPVVWERLPFPAALLLVTGAGAAAFWTARWARARTAWVGLVWFAVLIAPYLNAIPIFVAAADRYLYPATGGLALLAGMATARMWGIPVLRRAAAGAFLLAAILWVPAMWSWQQAWMDRETLWTRTLAANPASFAARIGLGTVRLEQGLPGEALALWEPLARGFPRAPHGWALCAVALQAAGRPAEAAGAYARAKALDPVYAAPLQSRQLEGYDPALRQAMQRLAEPGG